jgi:hypothetical protein
MAARLKGTPPSSYPRVTKFFEYTGALEENVADQGNAKNRWTFR